MENTHSQKKWVHIVGIAGVTTSALALEFKENGYEVTGSDENIYPPTDSILQKAGIRYFEQFHFSNLIKDYKDFQSSKDAISKGKKPDLVVMSSAKPNSNKELKFAKKNNLNIKSYPEVLNSEVVMSDKSIVIAGTYGKTSVTSMLVFGIQKFVDVSYMFGGFVDGFEKTLKFKNKSTKFSIIEGDEYLTSKYLDKRSKFFHYNPDILILTSVEWDHTDLFKTEAEYIDNFRNLVKEVPKDGIIFYKESKNILDIIKSAKCNTIKIDPYQAQDQIKNYNDENISFAKQIISKLLSEDISKLSFIDQNFSGVKRRFQIRYDSPSITVIDDFGSSPAKALGTISNIKKNFPKHKIIIIYEPNEGARTQESLPLYDGIFDDINTLILPDFRDIPERLTSEDLYKYLKNDLPAKLILVKNENLANEIIKNIDTNQRSVIAFLGSHSFEEHILSILDSVSR